MGWGGQGEGGGVGPHKHRVRALHFRKALREVLGVALLLPQQALEVQDVVPVLRAKAVGYLLVRGNEPRDLVLKVLLGVQGLPQPGL